MHDVGVANFSGSSIKFFLWQAVKAPRELGFRSMDYACCEFSEGTKLWSVAELGCYRRPCSLMHKRSEQDAMAMWTTSPRATLRLKTMHLVPLTSSIEDWCYALNLIGCTEHERNTRWSICAGEIGHRDTWIMRRGLEFAKSSLSSRGFDDQRVRWLCPEVRE